MDVYVFGIGGGWAELRFKYDPAFIARLKQVPGCRWVPEKKVWRAPEHALPLLPSPSVKLVWRAGVVKPQPNLHPGVIGNLRPYQVDGAQRLVTNNGFVLSFDMRVGKSRTAGAAAASMLADGRATTAVFLYPNTVKEEWSRQLQEQTGLVMLQLGGATGWTPVEEAHLVSLPHLAIGIHYELLGLKGRADDLRKLLDQRAGKFVIVADEAQWLKNRKAGRTKVALELARHANCGWRWALTGTPMRNYPRDMWAMFDFVQPDSMGSYSKFTGRYADGHMGDYGWEDDGATNLDELSARLTATSFRLLRRDVAQWLPKSDRSVVLCDMSPQDAKRYAQQEAVLGAQALKAMNEHNSVQSMAALKQLTTLTAGSKVSALLDRIEAHLQRGVKVLVFANFHETLNIGFDAFDTLSGMPLNAPKPKKPRFDAPGFLAGGWMMADKRRKAIDSWKACPGPAVLFANTLSSGVGIDLSDAEVAIFLELAWVPADFQQAEARIQDVHLGKRTTPPLYEYLLTRGTIDEDMGHKLIKKIAGIEAVVGADSEARALDDTIRNSGLVDRNMLTLQSEDPEVVEAALARLSARLLGNTDAVAPTDDTDNSDKDDSDDDESDNDEGGDDADE